MTSNAAAAGLLACAFWGTYFYFGCLQNHLGPFRFDSSEIPIITLYAMYLPIFLGFMREAREEPPFRRFVLPALALCSGLFMVIAGILSYQWDCLYYLLFFAVFMAAGALFYKRKSLSVLLKKPGAPNGAPAFQRTERQECGPVPFLQAAVPGADETEKKNTKAQGL